MGWPGRWKQQTAQNGLSLLVSLAKGLCPSCLHLQQTASPVHVCRILLGHLCPLRSERCLCTDVQDLFASFLNKKNTCCPLDNTRGVSCQFSPLLPHTSWQEAFSAAPTSHDLIENQMEMKSLGIHAAVRPKTTSGIVGGKKFLCVIVCQLNPHSVIQQVNNEKQAQNESKNTARPFMSTGRN